MQDIAHSQPELETLLRPVSEKEPAGSYLGNTPVYDEIRDARRSDDPNQSRGVWEREMRVAQWDRVEDLCVEALIEESKDLQIAVWLAEAWVHKRGIAGIRDGMDLVLRLTREFWGEAYPSLERGPEYRAAPFVWLNEKLVDTLGLVTVAQSAHPAGSSASWNDWKRSLWLEQLQSRHPGDDAVKAELEESVTRDAFDRMVSETPETFFVERIAALEEAVQTTRDLADYLDEQLDPDATSMTRFRGTLEEILDWMRTAVRSAAPVVPEVQSEEVQSEEVESEEDVDVSEERGPAVADTAPTELPPETGPISGRDDAYRRLLEAARYLKRIEPHSPTPYLVMKAVSWGDMSLDQLLTEFVHQGLNIEALFTFLGIEQEK